MAARQSYWVQFLDQRWKVRHNQQTIEHARTEGDSRQRRGEGGHG